MSSTGVAPPGGDVLVAPLLERTEWRNQYMENKEKFSEQELRRPLSAEALEMCVLAKEPLVEIMKKIEHLSGSTAPIQPEWTSTTPELMSHATACRLMDINEECLAMQQQPIFVLAGQDRQARSLLIWLTAVATWCPASGVYFLSRVRVIDTPEGHALIRESISKSEDCEMLFLKLLQITVFPPDHIPDKRPAGGVDDAPACFTFVQLAAAVRFIMQAYLSALPPCKGPYQLLMADMDLVSLICKADELIDNGALLKSSWKPIYDESFALVQRECRDLDVPIIILSKTLGRDLQTSHQG